MRIFIYTLLTSVVLSIFFCPKIPATEPDEKLHSQCIYPTVLIAPVGKTSYGSGFIVRSNKIAENEFVNVFVTAAHIADSYEQYYVKFAEYENWSDLVNTKTYPAAFYAKDYERDIAIGMFLSEERMPTATIDMDTRLYIGSDIFHVGCGLGDEPRLDYGKITSLVSKMGGSKYNLYRTSAHTVPGDSGGPLFNSKYKVVGICRSIRTWRNLPVFNISFYTPVTYLRDWSKEEDGAYDFVWKERAIPKMSFWELRFTRDNVITKVP